jgi:hypothetical protein
MARCFLTIYGCGYNSCACKLRLSEVRPGSFRGRFGPVCGPFGPGSPPNDPDRTSDNLRLQPRCTVGLLADDTLSVWVYQDCSNSQYPVLGLAGCSRPAVQGPKLPQKLPQNWPRNCPVCGAMTARKGRGGRPPGHLFRCPGKTAQNCPKLMDCYYNPDAPNPLSDTAGSFNVERLTGWWGGPNPINSWGLVTSMAPNLLNS